jgi:DNA gyrase/topoisomerase IV subunit B
MVIKMLTAQELIRKRLDMFLGDIKRVSLFEELVFESLCHAFDEAIDGDCLNVSLTIEPAGKVVTRYDAGISLKLDALSRPFADVIFSELSACSNRKKHIEIGSKFCRIGLAVLNAVSSELTVATVCGGKSGLQTYAEGKALGDFKITASDKPNETVIDFTFDQELLGTHEIQVENLRRMAEELTLDLPPDFNLVVVEAC